MDSFSWPSVLGPIMAGEDIGRVAAGQAMSEVMAGRATQAQIAGFIVGLRTKGETASELAGMVDAMMDAAVTVDVDTTAVDIVGTGGDGFGTFNISTTASFIAAGAGVKVAKHGNRAVSNPTGSADLLEALGFDLALPPEATVQMVEETGFGFFFAQKYHPAMREVGPTRKELGVRTVFNFLGPLCNPAGARMCVGTSDAGLARLMIDVLAARGVDRGFVVYGEDGIDELSISAPSRIYRLIDGEVTEAEFTPEDFGVERVPVTELVGGTADENIAITRSILAGDPGPRRDAAVVNATPAIVLAGLAQGFVDAMEVAIESIDSGAAKHALDESLRLSQQLSRSHP
ncbi:MAG: anthranilate phosphoribosyltransferase [Acidimicrobiia bacterium]|nr:anthranilate phosphoribosyltransferase [Acidimicrobiia bacterium]